MATGDKFFVEMLLVKQPEGMPWQHPLSNREEIEVGSEREGQRLITGLLALGLDWVLDGKGEEGNEATRQPGNEEGAVSGGRQTAADFSAGGAGA